MVVVRGRGVGCCHYPCGSVLSNRTSTKYKTTDSLDRPIPFAFDDETASCSLTQTPCGYFPGTVKGCHAVVGAVAYMAHTFPVHAKRVLGGLELELAAYSYLQPQ